MKQKQTKTQKNKKIRNDRNLEKSIKADTSLIRSFYNLITDSADTSNDGYTYLSQVLDSDKNIKFSNYISNLVSSGLLEPMGGEFSSDPDLDLSISPHVSSFSFYKYIPIDKPRKIDISAYRETIEKLSRKYENQGNFKDILLSLSKMKDQDIDLLINSDVYICIREFEQAKTTVNQEDSPRDVDIDRDRITDREPDFILAPDTDGRIEFFIFYKGLGQQVGIESEADDGVHFHPNTELCPFDSLKSWNSFVYGTDVISSFYSFLLLPCALDSFLYLLGETTRGGGEQEEFYGFLVVLNKSLTYKRERSYFTWGKEKIIMQTAERGIGELVESENRSFAYIPEGGQYIYD